MSRRLLAWVFVAPLSLAGVLGGHALAYGLTGTDPGTVHAYLEHVPQIALIAALTGLVLLAFQQRAGGTGRPWPYACLGLVTFAVQEHAERLAHGDALPFLLTDRAFLAGLALQVPIALLCAALARLVSGTMRLRSRPPRRRATFCVQYAPVPAHAVRGPALAHARGRAPPPRLR